ncbi:hypothetical protein BsWGS_09314 [Bradybaena similaris]
MYNMSLLDILGFNPLEGDTERTEICDAATDISAIYLWVLFAIGVPGNILTIITTLSMQTLSPATFFVALLAFFDGSALVVKLTYQQLMKYHHPLGDIGCKMDFLAPYLATVANWMLVLICAERFISVCYPLKKISVITKRRSYMSAAVVAGVFLVLFGIMSVIMRGDGHGECGTLNAYVDFWKIYWYWINFALFLIIPFLIILIFTCGIIRGLYLSRRDRRILLQKGSGRETGNESAAGNHSRLVAETERVELAITIMMILAATLFLTFSLPACVYTVISDPSSEGKCNTKSQAYWTLFQQIKFLLVDATHALNFFMYFFAARRFRSQLFKVLRCKTCKKVKYQHTISSQLSSSTKANSNVCLQNIK